MLSELAVFGIWVSAELLLIYLPFTIHMRKEVDQNSNGQVDVQEVPFITRTDKMPVVVDRPFLTELSLGSFARTLLEAFLHAFTYGCIMVFAMNWFMGAMDRRFTYLMTAMMIMMACLFMCEFATNGVHVVTSHKVHFIYYGCGYTALIYFWWGPLVHGYLVACVALISLVAHYISRSYGLPNYPLPGKLVRLYKYDPTSGTWFFASAPKDTMGSRKSAAEQQPVGEETPLLSKRSDIWKESSSEEEQEIPGEVEGGCPPPGEFTHWALTFPTYEIFHGHLTSNFAIGVIIASITSILVGLTGVASTVSETSLACSIVLAALCEVLLIQRVGFFGEVEKGLHKQVLARYWPITTAVLMSVLGACCVVLELDFGGQASSFITWTSHVSLIIVFVVAFVVPAYYVRERMRDL